MERYDYRYVVTDDLKTFIWENDLWDEEEEGPAFEDREAFVEHMNRVADSDRITGAARGFYVEDSWYAEENLCHNTDLLIAACEALKEPVDIDRPKKCDMLIRKYIVGDCIERLADYFYGKTA